MRTRELVTNLRLLLARRLAGLLARGRRGTNVLLKRAGVTGASHLGNVVLRRVEKIGNAEGAGRGVRLGDVVRNLGRGQARLRLIISIEVEGLSSSVCLLKKVQGAISSLREAEALRRGNNRLVENVRHVDERGDLKSLMKKEPRGKARKVQRREDENLSAIEVLACEKKRKRWKFERRIPPFIRQPGKTEQ